MIRRPAFSIMDVEDTEKKDKRVLPKEFVSVRSSNGLYSVRLTAGGEVPDVLKGVFTSSARAETAIAAHQERVQNAAASR